MPTENLLMMLGAFAMVSSFMVLRFMLVGGRRTRVESSLQGLSGRGRDEEGAQALKQVIQQTLPKMGSALLPSSQEDRSRLQPRLTHAGLYGKQAMYFFLGIKLLLMIAPAVIGLMLGL